MVLQIDQLLFIMTVVSIIDTSQGTTCSSNVMYLDATEVVKTLTSPGYPDDFESNVYCRWVLRTKDKHKVVQVTVTDSKLPSSINCNSDYLQIQDGEGLYSFSLRKCCGAETSSCEGDSVTSSEQKMRITFKSDNSVSDKGFQLKYWAVTKVSKLYKKPEWGPVNYFLFTLFGVIICSIIMGLIIVGVGGRRKAPDRPRFKCNSSILKPISGLIVSVALVFVGLPIFIGVIYTGVD